MSEFASQQPHRSPLPQQPPYPDSGLTESDALQGMIFPFCGPIDYETYLLDRKHVNSNEIIDFGPTPSNNTGWILCDGCTVEAVVFPQLFNALGYLYGKGKKAGQFMVPDYRGTFLRALDTDSDPKKLDTSIGERKVYGTGQRPVNGSTGKQAGAGSVEKCLVQWHEHHYFNYPAITPAQGRPTATVKPVKVTTDAETEDLLIDGIPVSSNDAKETRPVNIYVNYLIYAGLPGRVL